MLRKPAVAGTFYPDDADGITALLKAYVDIHKEKEKAIGVVSPHAGYIYSGVVAGELFASVELPPTAVILAPDHRGAGTPFALFPEGSWQTPIGNVEVDGELVSAIQENSKLAEIVPDAHLYEHSAEVQVPFLQYIKGDIKIVAVMIATMSTNDLVAFGKELAHSVKGAKKDVLVVASSDMTHYESHESASAKDKIAIEQILKLDEQGLVQAVRENNITMCGVAPAVSMLAYAKEMGATEARLVKYMTSGQTSGDYTQVVGYAGILVK
jgi:AmmeMemoRadiSam system protein B